MLKIEIIKYDAKFMIKLTKNVLKSEFVQYNANEL